MRNTANSFGTLSRPAQRQRLQTFCLLSACLITVCQNSATAAEQVIRVHGPTMGTTWNATIVGTGDAADIERLVQTELDRIDTAMSTWKPDSEVSRFNRHPGTDWFLVSPATARVVRTALQVSEATNGAFDVTVSPLIDLWHFGSAHKSPTLPAEEQVAAAMEHTGWQKLHARLDPPALRKDDTELQINLSAIAKGYAVDRTAAALAGAGYTSFLVEVGGEICARGTRPDGAAWQVGIEAPDPRKRRVRQAIPLTDRALATSGDYRNFYEVDGKTYSHTIDPRTGHPVEHTLTAVTVLADTCLEADAWATALMVSGPEESLALAKANGIAAQLTIRNGDGSLTDRTTPGLTALQADDGSSRPNGSTATVFIAALVVFLLAVVGMALGVIISNRRLKGSCGGLSGMTDESGQSLCQMCTSPSPECTGNPEAASTQT